MPIAKPYKSLTPNPDECESEVLATVLEFDRAMATIKDHGCDSDEFLNERLAFSKPVTLGELRDFLGY